MSLPVVVIGTGLAGYNLAKEFRKLDRSTPLTLITSDTGHFYSKPVLSTSFSKQKSAQDLVIADATAMATQLDAEVRTSCTVTQIDPENRSIWVGNECIFYRDLIIATGAEPILPYLEGNACNQLTAINDLTDYACFQMMAAKDARRVLILGMGLIGCEIANDLLMAGYDISLIAPCDHPMPSLLPVEAARAVQLALEELGAKFYFDTTVIRLDQHSDRRVATLSSGQTIDFDLVVSAIGLRPRTHLARAAGINCNVGICVDRWLKASHPHVFALGDCAEVDGRNFQYILPLMAGARALAQTLAGTATAVSYPPMPVTVKTPCCPVVVAPPQRQDYTTHTKVEAARNITTLFTDPDGALKGFALTGNATKGKADLLARLAESIG